MTDRQAVSRMPVADRGFQIRFLLLLSCIFAVGALFLFAVMYLYFSKPLDNNYTSEFFALRHLTEFALPMVSFSALVYVLLVCGAMAVLCIYTLHKVAGPLYRMSRVIESYILGDTLKPMAFRDGDQAAFLATLFNDYIERLREDGRNWEKIMERAEQAGQKDPVALQSAMDKALEDLDLAVSKYR